MPQPSKIPLAFAASGDKNIIPESTETTGLASWRDGFPAITSTPFSEGGIAPKRADFNGIFNALSLATLWQQQGGFYAYDAMTDYEVGNVVEYNNDLYKCRTVNGPSSSVKAPTDTTVWSKVMTAADAAALYLPLSGGEMSGPIRVGGTNGSLALWGADNTDGGANLILWGKDHPANPGYFALRAKNGVNNIQLVGRPNGELLWNNRYIPTFSTGTWTPVIDGRSTSGTVTKTFSKSIYVKNGPLVYCVVSGDYGPITGGSGSVVLRPSSFPYTIEGNGLSGTMFWNDNPYPMYYYTNNLIYFRKTDTMTDLLCSDVSSSKTFTMAFVYHTTD